MSGTAPSRVLVLGAGVGFAAGTAAGFAAAPDHVGVPPLLGALGLLLGLGVAASTRIGELKRAPAVRRRAPGVPARAPATARPTADVQAPTESVAEDDQWVVPPGWYPDPRGVQPTRYWDGAGWTDEVAESTPDGGRSDLPLAP